MGAGQEIDAETVNAIVDAYANALRAVRGPAKVLPSDGEWVLNSEQSEAILANLKFELHIRVSGLRAAGAEAPNGILRVTMRHLEADVERRSMPVNIRRVLTESVFAFNALAFYSGALPHQAFAG